MPVDWWGIAFTGPCSRKSANCTGKRRKRRLVRNALHYRACYNFRPGIAPVYMERIEY